MLSRSDITEFTRYRNLPSIARYQDWPVPYTRDLAHELVDEMERLTGPTPGTWVQLAIEQGGRLVGDYAVWLDPDAHLAMVGYTIAPEHQGRSLAVTATDLVVEWLFAHQGVHRIAATIDPRNAASARVLERCGFGYVGTAPEAAWSRGEWTDDARFSLLEPQWRAWRSRAIGSPCAVELVDVDADNVERVLALELPHSQRSFGREVGASIAIAHHRRQGANRSGWYRAVLADGEVCGFVMVEAGPAPRIVRLLIDRRHQRRGIAPRVVGLVARTAAVEGDEQLEVCYVDEPGGPGAFFAGLGFTSTGRRSDDGEIVACGDVAVLCRLTGPNDVTPADC
jgi:RimJ/RimL family protein N-acetyltransferase